ncbi:MAG: ATP-binding protein [Spirochaetaceae bacterium]|nr:ATP-binding protein [Spirochaetaceae bacterium]
MEKIIRIKNIKINNIKNVCTGEFKTNTDFESMGVSDVIGFYGQNGSGKTAIVEVFSILQQLLQNSPLPSIEANLLTKGKEEIRLSFDFLIVNKYGEFSVNYDIILKEGENRLYVFSEELTYREIIPYKKPKNIINKKGEDILIKLTKLKDLPEEDRINSIVINKTSKKENTSFIFNKDMLHLYSKYLNDTEMELINNLSKDFLGNFYIINDTQNGMVLANLLMPFSTSVENKRKIFNYNLESPTLLEEDCYFSMKKIIEQINIVLKNIIPNLQINVKSQENNKEIMVNGKSGIRFELLSEKNGVFLPLKCESAGILKLISILSSLIKVSNNSNACIVIDELDSGIFEYLLGDIIKAIDETGKGQFIFTSHNLRVLEVLNFKKIWVTTNNPDNRFIQLKGVRTLSNARDIYLRSLLLGGQKESLYDETDSYELQKSFIIAGKNND